MANSFFGQHSMYHQTPATIIDGVSTIGSWNRPSWILARPDERYIHKYMVPSGYAGRPDLIALAVYNVDDLDWVLLTFNNVSNVFGWPKAGTVIEIPDESIIFPSL